MQPKFSCLMIFPFLRGEAEGGKKYYSFQITQRIEKTHWASPYLGSPQCLLTQNTGNNDCLFQYGKTAKHYVYSPGDIDLNTLVRRCQEMPR